MPTVETNGIETFYHDYGSGHPLVVLHGAMATHQGWAQQLQTLADEYRVLPYDLRGHGKTGGSDRDSYTVETYADDLAAFIDALDLDQPAVLGHSLGGMVGYAFADGYPEKLSALITVGSATPETFSAREWIFRTAVSRLLFPAMGNERVMNAVVRAQTALLGDESTVDMDELEQLREAHDCTVPELSTTERSKVLHAAKDYYTSSWSWQLFGLPVLMLYGENEPFIEPHAGFLEAELEDCRTAEIPEGSHNAHVDNPEFIRTKLREFLGEVNADRERAATR
ncbi:alpha/beta fold hydrolase [Halobacterium rubrum]|uniref:alpha/beta fold hydrolase n=1 Tax=Halobacterium TaxID=2239 RepID=UPI001F259392|nr:MULTISPECIES: alpha/beta hydrolase [Halobacterium]MDH5018911.1 alpha/beta hydrolase [Halobacterium rubrum]